MEDFIIILIGVLVLVMLALIAWYNHMDRLRFRMDRLLKAARPALDDWADICEELHPGSADAYYKTRRNWEKVSHIQSMVYAVKENNEDKLNLQEELLDFCYQYSNIAKRYNEKLESPFTGKLSRIMGFPPYSPLDFYPHIHPEIKKQD